MAAGTTWKVEPVGPLRGDVTVRGSKNAVTKHMVAALLADSPSVISNAPEIGDVDITETILLTAALAEGRTIIENAATEPEVIELALFLQRMGAHLELRPDRRFIIEGVERLSGATHRLMGDRIEAFSYLVAGLMTGGEVRVHGCPQGRLITAIST